MCVCVCVIILWQPEWKLEENRAQIDKNNGKEEQVLKTERLGNIFNEGAQNVPP